MEHPNLKLLILENAAFYDAQMNEVRLRMFAQELSDLPFEKVAHAFAMIRRDKSKRQMPLPADIRDLVAPDNSSDIAVARVVVSRIIYAVSKIGYMQSEDARKYIGEVGWRVVQSQGGWKSICETLGDTLDVGIAQAQWRDLALSFIEMNRAGKLNTPIDFEQKNLGQREENKMLSMGDILKLTQEKTGRDLTK